MELPVKERSQQVQVAVKERKKSVELLFLELTEKVKQSESLTLDIARLVYELHGLGITDQRISDRLQSAGVMLSRATITTYRGVWQYFVVQLGLLEYIKGIPMSVLITLKSYGTIAKAPRERIMRILAEVKGVPAERAIEHIRQEFGDTKKESKFATLKIERPVYEMFDRVHKKLSAVAEATTGHALSPTQALEFVLKLFDEADIDAIKEVWLKEIGEEVQ